MKDNKLNPIRIAIFIIVVLMIAGGFFAYWYLSHKKPVSNSTPVASSTADTVTLSEQAQEFKGVALKFIALDTNFYRNLEGKDSKKYFEEICTKKQSPEDSRSAVAKEAVKMLTDDFAKQVSKDMHTECGYMNAPSLAMTTSKVLEDKVYVTNESNGRITFSVPVEITTTVFYGTDGVITPENVKFSNSHFINKSTKTISITVVKEKDQHKIAEFSGIKETWSAIWTAKQ